MGETENQRLFFYSNVKKEATKIVITMFKLVLIEKGREKGRINHGYILPHYSICSYGCDRNHVCFSNIA